VTEDNRKTDNGILVFVQVSFIGKVSDFYSEGSVFLFFRKSSRQTQRS